MVGCLNNKPGGTGTISENRGLGRVMSMSPGAGHLDSKAAPVKSYHSKSRLSGTKQLVYSLTDKAAFSWMPFINVTFIDGDLKDEAGSSY